MKNVNNKNLNNSDEELEAPPLFEKHPHGPRNSYSKLAKQRAID
jgi:hypothetical protein